MCLIFGSVGLKSDMFLAFESRSLDVRSNLNLAFEGRNLDVRRNMNLAFGSSSRDHSEAREDWFWEKEKSSRSAMADVQQRTSNKLLGGRPKF